MATNPALTRQASRRRDDPVVTGLGAQARNGDRQAWNALVDRYAPLIWSICRSHRLEAADTQDAAQNIWLQLMDHLGSLRDPAALPGWLATHPARMPPHPAHGPASLRRRVRAGRRDHPRRSRPGGRAGPARSRTARGAAGGVRAAAPGCQQLLAPLIDDPAQPYAEISASLGIPAGSIGPSRRRCLDKLRRHPAITALINAGTQTATRDAWPQ